jgi:exodeoxyribonuclease VII small subunit
MSFEKKIDKSKELLEKLMDPDITLSESVKLYKNGLKELQSANKLLEEAKLQFEEYKNQDNKEEE